VLLGTLNIGLFFPLLFVAAYRLPGGVAAVAGALGPFAVAGLSFILFSQRANPRLLVAASVGVAGVVLLVVRSQVALDPLGLLAAAAATLFMSTGTVLGRRWSTPDGFRGSTSALVVLTGWQLTAGGLVVLPLAVVLEGLPPALTVRNMVGFGYLSLVGTALAYVIWFGGVTRLAPVKVTLLALLSPLVAAVLGWVVLDQTLTPTQLLGALAVVLAVAAGTSTSGAGRMRRLPWASSRPAPASARAQRRRTQDKPVVRTSWLRVGRGRCTGGCR
jgi:probable blue pigment (indigoidine) exporter